MIQKTTLMTGFIERKVGSVLGLVMEYYLKLFNANIVKKLGFSFRKYQEYVAYEIVESIREGHKFIIVSMPTGSGKTLIEMFTAFYGLEMGFPRILVLEPTRFLCDQMHSGGVHGGRGLWSRVFEDLAGKEYEGNCSSFLEPSKKIVLSTPQTALKCVSTLEKEFRMVIIDEVHHAFGGKYYAELLAELEPDVIVGFTALLPSHKRYRLDPRVKYVVGDPHLLVYDFKRLEEVDPNFKPPKAVADVFDAEMDDRENSVYDTLFRALPQGDPRTIKFLEVTLARYGEEAFCESYRRALEKGKIELNNTFEGFCKSGELSHKARALIDVLTVYDIRESNALKPVLVFTSRKATAKEFAEAIIRHIGLPEERVATLSSDMSKEERIELIKKAKSGEIDVIVSTLVGEEGIDIPEAGLLIMTDVPRSPLRFYQRLGRLIRMSSQQRMKYLVVTLTPKTVEYWDLEDALWNLYAEGVDVSYIIVNIGEKAPGARVLDTIDNFAKIYNDVSIPYTLLAFGQELSNPLNYILSVIKGRKDLVEIVRETMKEWGFQIETEEDLDTAIYYILTFHMLRSGNVKKIFEPIDNAVNKSRFSKELDKAIRERRVFYIYDVGMMSDVISYELQRLYKVCIDSGTCFDVFFRLDRKSILRLFARVFLYDDVGHIINKLEERMERFKKYLDEAKKNGVFKSYTVGVDWGGYNEWAKTIPLKLVIYLDLGDARIGLDAQINYHDVSEELLKDENITELIEKNLLAIGYEASKKFLDHLYESAYVIKGL